MEQPAAQLLLSNMPLASELGLAKWLSSDNALGLISGQSRGEQEAIAMAYSGHQFGHLSPRLGDGRAVLLGEYAAPSGTLYDIHLKGSGRTPFSRGGDGKSTLRGALKEYLFSEALAALGIPGTRSLAVFTTGDKVIREEIHAGATLVRLARSHVRVGTFQYAAMQQKENPVSALAAFIIQREFPELLAMEDDAQRIRGLLSAVCERQAYLVAHWMSHGFIHGVMNTDNMAISGETIDFGPCAFMDDFNSNQVFSSIDEGSRYAWGRQSAIAGWNLARFAETLLPHLHSDNAQAVEIAKAELEQFDAKFSATYVEILCAKLGFSGLNNSVSEHLSACFEMLQDQSVDFTLFFRYLSDALGDAEPARLLALFTKVDLANEWIERWKALLLEQGEKRSEIIDRMNAINPVNIPRTYQVEHALSAANEGDMSPFLRLLEAVTNPYDEREEWQDLIAPPVAQQAMLRTFCET